MLYKDIKHKAILLLTYSLRSPAFFELMWTSKTGEITEGKKEKLSQSANKCFNLKYSVTAELLWKQVWTARRSATVCLVLFIYNYVTFEGKVQRGSSFTPPDCFTVIHIKWLFSKLFKVFEASSYVTGNKCIHVFSNCVNASSQSSACCPRGTSKFGWKQKWNIVWNTHSIGQRWTLDDQRCRRWDVISGFWLFF